MLRWPAAGAVQSAARAGLMLKILLPAGRADRSYAFNISWFIEDFRASKKKFPLPAGEMRDLSDRPNADVAPAEALRPVDPVDRRVGEGSGSDEILAEGGDPEHPAAIGEQPSVVATGPGMEDFDLRIGRRLREAADLAAALGLLRIALGRHDDAQRMLGVPPQIDRFQHPVARGD